MKYSLRSLLIAAILGPPLLAGIYFFVRYLQKADGQDALLLLGMAGSGAAFIFGILDYRMQPRPSRIIAILFALFAFAYFLAVLCT